ncbi:hypothetical protein EVAR_8138_1 [Eumeta japonica]|uniref:Uncharacterized protein n=1 Tax=Eumeta variegata TaxID=151549 RepID=A0A4C1TST0_EUMVA|nr:hypothetical protein EVAR_8138_1 [Eumeta japonica]
MILVIGHGHETAARGRGSMGRGVRGAGRSRPCRYLHLRRRVTSFSTRLRPRGHTVNPFICISTDHALNQDPNGYPIFDSDRSCSRCHFASLSIHTRIAVRLLISTPDLDLSKLRFLISFWIPVPLSILTLALFSISTPLSPFDCVHFVSNFDLATGYSSDLKEARANICIEIKFKLHHTGTA